MPLTIALLFLGRLKMEVLGIRTQGHRKEMLTKTQHRKRLRNLDWNLTKIPNTKYFLAH
jgi:hypothetical protein